MIIAFYLFYYSESLQIYVFIYGINRNLWNKLSHGEMMKNLECNSNYYVSYIVF